MYENKLSQCSLATPPSFIRSILKTTESEDLISFAGGLPNPISFPIEDLKASANRIIDTYGSKVFQYSQTAGLPQLRNYIAKRLNQTQGMQLTADDIILTTGSQQALDLIGKVLIDKKDHVLLEKPAYLGAIQAFSQYQPTFHMITLEADGMDLGQLEKTLQKHSAKFLYIVPNFQNPSGLTYSDEKRKALFALVQKYQCILVEDDPYGDLKFDGKPNGYISKANPSDSILLGTFSKTVTPGMRLGYMVITDAKLRMHINTAKEAADLHSNIFAQYLLYDYLTTHDIEEHIEKIRNLYREQCDTMLNAMNEYFPASVTFTKPEGGMFIWATLPEGISSLELFEKAKEQKVVFVPGNPFYTDDRDANTMRLNYTNSSREMIIEGIKRLGKLITEELEKKKVP